MVRGASVHRAIIVGTALFGISRLASASTLTQSPYLTTTMDPFSATWYARGANTSDPTAGLPDAGVIHSLSDPSSTFLLQPYNANNVLFLTNEPAYRTSGGVSTGTLTFTQPLVGAKSLAFAMAAAASGNPTLNLTIHYSDGTPDLATTLGPVPDWIGGGAPIIATGSGKAFAPGTTVTFEDNSDTNVDMPRISEVSLTLPPPAQFSPQPTISSIDISTPLLTQQGTIVAIFGLSASTGNGGFGLYNTPVLLTPSSFNQDIVIEAVPEPATAGLSALGAGILLTRRRRKLAD